MYKEKALLHPKQEIKKIFKLLHAYQYFSQPNGWTLNKKIILFSTKMCKFC